MTFDLVLLGLVLAFAAWGAWQGASKQIANLIALPVAFLVAGPAAEALGPFTARKLSSPLVVGTVASGFIAFLLTYVVVRLVVAAIFERLLAGKEKGDRGPDRALGAALGGLKIVLVAWVVVCALSFIETNVQIAGKRLGVSPKDSVTFQLARKFNLFELTLFSGVGELEKASALLQDPQSAGRLKDTPDFQALLKDQRVQSVLKSEVLRRALAQGDTRTLLEDDQVIRLLADPQAMRRLERLNAARRQ